MPKTSPSRFTMVPLRKSSEPTATRRARIIMALGGVAALAGPIALGAVLLGGNSEVDFSSVDPEGRAVADAAAFEMASDGDLKIPTARTFDPESTGIGTGSVEVDGQPVRMTALPYPVDSTTWTGFDRNTFTDGSVETTFEVHRYLLVPDLDEYVEKYEDEKGRGSRTPEDETSDEEAGNEETEGGNTSGTTPDPSDGGGDESGTDQEGTGDEPAEEEDTSGKPEQEQILAEGVTPYELQVSVVITDNGPRLAAAPALAPWTAAEASPSGAGDYSNYGSLKAETNSQTARQVGRWAVAYAEADEDTLLEVTGDPDTSHRYTGLGGWRVADASSSVQILSAISVNEGDQLLRVRVLLEDTRSNAEKTEQPYRMYADFDVLVSDPESATPSVVAWGAAGSGASLTPYSNSIS